MSQFDWPIAKKKVEIMEALQNRRFYGKMECLPLWPTCVSENWRTLHKTYGTKERCYWVHIGNQIGSHWELERKHVGNKGKMKKISPPPHPKIKRKKSGTLSAC
jgi:hypothetical protein